jgi:hypothetical protein
MRLSWAHVAIGLEAGIMSTALSWIQTPSGKQWLSLHVAIADIIGSAYIGLNAARAALNMQQQNRKDAGEAGASTES